jgi:hypothetical protein
MKTHWDAKHPSEPDSRQIWPHHQQLTIVVLRACAPTELPAPDFDTCKKPEVKK